MNAQEHDHEPSGCAICGTEDVGRMDPDSDTCIDCASESVQDQRRAVLLADAIEGAIQQYEWHARACEQRDWDLGRRGILTFVGNDGTIPVLVYLIEGADCWRAEYRSPKLGRGNERVSKPTFERLAARA